MTHYTGRVLLQLENVFELAGITVLPERGSKRKKKNNTSSVCFEQSRGFILHTSRGKQKYQVIYNVEMSDRRAIEFII